MSKIREINADNMVEFLNSRGCTEMDFNVLPYVQRPGAKFFRENTMALINFFFDEYTEIFFEKKRGTYQGTPMFLREEIIQKPLRNLNQLSFYSFYPYIILKLCEEGEAEFSIKEYAEIYSFMVKELVEIEKHPNITDGSKYLLRFMKNYLYAASNIENHIIKLGVSNIDKVIHYYKDTLTELFDTFPNVVYVDCDMIFYQPDDEYDVEEFIKIIDIPYGIKEDINAFFLAKKKYIVDIDGEIIVKGPGDPRRVGYKPPPRKFQAVETGLRLLEDMQMTRKLKKLICLSQIK